MITRNKFQVFTYFMLLQIESEPSNKKLYPQKHCWYHFQCQWYLALASALFKILPKSIIGTIPNTDDILRQPAPFLKFYQKVSLVPFLIPIITYAHPAPFLKYYSQKVSLVQFLISIITYAHPGAPPQILSWKGIVGTTPNTNHNLRYPAPLLKLL